MVKNIKLEIKNNKFGQIALLLTLVILAAVLSIGVGLTLIIIKEIRIAKNVEESAKALSAANAGMEYALYRIDQGVDSLNPLDRICGEGGETQLNNNSEYCLNTDNPDDPTSITSVGKSGTVKRAINTTKPDDIDQEIKGNSFLCLWRNILDPSFEDQPLAQTFVAGRSGNLYKVIITIAEPLEDGKTLEAHIIGTDSEYTNSYYNLVTRPEDFNNAEPYVSTTSDISYFVGSYSYEVPFIFDPPLQVERGRSYSLVVHTKVCDDTPCGWIGCCAHYTYWKRCVGGFVNYGAQGRGYFPGEGWRQTGSSWDRTLSTTSGIIFGDFYFKTYVSSVSGSDFEEVKEVRP